MKKKTSTTPAVKMYAHLFDADCMNYCATFEGYSREDIIESINEYINDSNQYAEYVVIWGKPESIEHSGIKLVDVPIYDIHGIDVR